MPPHEKRQHSVHLQPELIAQAELPINQQFNEELAILEARLRQSISEDAWSIFLQLERLTARMHEKTLTAVFLEGSRYNQSIKVTMPGSGPH